MPASPTRRAALAGAGVYALFGLSLASAAARPRRAPPQGGIRVDVGPLRANGSETIAGWVERVMPGALAQAFAQRGMAGAPVSVRIDYVTLGPSSGAAGPGGSSPDQMIGQATVNGVTRPVRATTWYYPSPFDQPLFEQSNFYRVQKLTEAFAYWVAQGY